MGDNVCESEGGNVESSTLATLSVVNVETNNLTVRAPPGHRLSRHQRAILALLSSRDPSLKWEVGTNPDCSILPYQGFIAEVARKLGRIEKIAVWGLGRLPNYEDFVAMKEMVADGSWNGETSEFVGPSMVSSVSRAIRSLERWGAVEVAYFGYHPYYCRKAIRLGDVGRRPEEWHGHSVGGRFIRVTSRRQIP